MHECLRKEMPVMVYLRLKSNRKEVAMHANTTEARLRHEGRERNLGTDCQKLTKPGHRFA